MNCRGIDLHNPFLWILITGLFFGVTVAHMTLSPAKSRNPERTRATKWVWVCIFASLFIGSGTAALFMAAPSALADRDVLVFGGGIVVFCGLAFRFRKIFGILFITLAVGFILYTSVILSPLGCTSETREIGWFILLSREEGKASYELSLEDDSEIVELRDGPVYVSGAVVLVEKYYILRGGKLYYRVEGLLPAPGSGEEGPRELRRIRKASSVLPGFDYSEQVSKTVSPEIFLKYSIFLHSDGTIELSPQY